MNTTGFIRGYLSKNLSNEKYLKHVTECIEQELKQWDEHYKLMVVKLTNYEIVVTHKTTTYFVSISESELDSLQNRSPYALDRKIWTEFANQGLKLVSENGNYLDYVFYKVEKPS